MISVSCVILLGLVSLFQYKVFCGSFGSIPADSALLPTCEHNCEGTAAMQDSWAFGKCFICNMTRSWCTYFRRTAAGCHTHVPQCRMPHPGHPMAHAHYMSKCHALYSLGVHPHASRSQGNAGELTPAHPSPITCASHTQPPYPTTMEPHHSHGHHCECLPTQGDR